MDLMKANDLALTLMQTHGLRGRWALRFDRAQRRLGMCDLTGRVIHLSRAYVTYADEESVRDTILHEIAHALAYEQHGDCGHGPAWKRIALAIGGSGQRTGENPAHDALQRERRVTALGSQRSHSEPTAGHLAGRLSAGARVVIDSSTSRNCGDVMVILRPTRNGYYRAIHQRTGVEWRIHNTRFRLHVAGEDLKHVDATVPDYATELLQSA